MAVCVAGYPNSFRICHAIAAGDEGSLEAIS